jgi:hypothetical protein
MTLLHILSLVCCRSPSHHAVPFRPRSQRVLSPSGNDFPLQLLTPGGLHNYWQRRVGFAALFIQVNPQSVFDVISPIAS